MACNAVCVGLLLPWSGRAGLPAASGRPGTAALPPLFEAAPAARPCSRQRRFPANAAATRRYVLRARWRAPAVANRKSAWSPRCPCYQTGREPTRAGPRRAVQPPGERRRA